MPDKVYPASLLFSDDTAMTCPECGTVLTDLQPELNSRGIFTGVVSVTHCGIIHKFTPLLYNYSTVDTRPTERTE